MANEPYITKKDLETVTQKVTINNAKQIAQPLIDQQKNNDLKELEQRIEQKVLFQDIADSIKGLGDSLLDGLKSLIPKTDGGLSKLLGLGLGLLLAPFVGFISFLGQLGKELNFFTGGAFGKIVEKLKVKFKAFFSGIFNKLKNSKLGKFISRIVGRLKNSKLFKSISKLFQKVFGKGGFFKKLVGIFSKIVKFTTGGPFKAILGFAGKIGRILGKVFLPITILMSVFDFVKGFMRGYEEDGIVGGIKEGFNELFEGLVGGLLRILMWIPTKIAEWLGFDNLAEEIGKSTETIIQSVKDIFGGLVDFVKALFDWDTEAMGEALGKIWDGIKGVVLAPFGLIEGFVEDIFTSESLSAIKDKLESISRGVLDFFADIGEKVADKLGLPKPSSPSRNRDSFKGLSEMEGAVDGKVIPKLSPVLKDLQKITPALENLDGTIEKSNLIEKEKLRKFLEENYKMNNSSLSSINTNNNVTYVIQNGNSLSASAMRAMMT